MTNLSENNQAYINFKAKLAEMFMLDQADLDFGIYRIMNAKRAEIVNFLDKDLRPQVERIINALVSTNQLTYESMAQTATHQSQEDRARYLRERLASINNSQFQTDVFIHLLTFFSRYYDKGDFISQRRYNKDDAYALPYNGEEVKLHWANADQYYVKSSEYFRDYTFTLADGRSVQFKLVDADTEVNNNKATANNERRFALMSNTEHSVRQHDNQTLIISFTYTVQTDKQDKLNEESVRGIETQLNSTQLNSTQLNSTQLNSTQLNSWHKALFATDKNGKSIITNRLNDYTKRNTYDYFIHKNLGQFLRRELDFYIKNEMLKFDDDTNTESDIDLSMSLVRIKAFRSVGHKIIDFLAQLEDFQKKLWLKKKFVVETNYCVTLDLVDEKFYPEIIKNNAQIQEWVKLFAIDEVTDDTQIQETPTTQEVQSTMPITNMPQKQLRTPFSNPLTLPFLKENKFLVLDTKFFDQSFKDRLLNSFAINNQNIDDVCSGLLIHSENFQALNILQKRYKEQVKCIYIDPPYNTGGDGFLYKDHYQHSSWASMIDDRLRASKSFLNEEGAFFASIDELEQPVLRFALDAVLGRENFVADMVWAAGRKNDSRLVSVSHEYIISYARSRERLVTSKIEWRQRKKGLEEIYSQYEKIKKSNSTDYAAMTTTLKSWFRDLPDGHPAKAHRHYCHVDARGVYFPADISWPGGGGPKYEVLHPRTGRPVKIPSRGWMFSDPTKLQALIADDRIHFGADEEFVPCTKSYLVDREFQTPYSVFYQDGRAATKRLRDVLGADDFGYPKDETIVAELIAMTTNHEDTILDFFAGSGTTGHAVINLNHKYDGHRKFILVEMGNYFDTVLLPRIKKVSFTSDWKDGKPVNRAGISHMFKYMRLESYEDTLNNVRMVRSANQQSKLDEHTPFREEYMLNYMLDIESRGSASLLNQQAFLHPFDYTLNVVSGGSVGETVSTQVDMLETFNYLIGLRVNHIRTHDGVRTVDGISLDEKRILVIWRDVETTNSEQLWNILTSENYDLNSYAIIYVNGDTTIGGKLSDGSKIRLTDAEFHHRMFDGSGQ